VISVKDEKKKPMESQKVKGRMKNKKREDGRSEKKEKQLK
jgi:hypothetical protein